MGYLAAVDLKFLNCHGVEGLVALLDTGVNFTLFGVVTGTCALGIDFIDVLFVCFMTCGGGSCCILLDTVVLVTLGTDAVVSTLGSGATGEGAVVLSIVAISRSTFLVLSPACRLVIVVLGGLDKMLIMSVAACFR